MILSMLIGGTSIHKYVLRPNAPKLRDASVYIFISIIYDNRGLTLINILIVTMCHMDLVPHYILSTADSNHNSSNISWAITGYKF